MTDSMHSVRGIVADRVWGRVEDSVLCRAADMGGRVWLRAGWHLVDRVMESLDD